MPKRDNPIKQWNAITYLQDFINTCLPLTYEEERIYRMLSGESLDIKQPKPPKTESTDWHLNKKLRAKGLVLCKGCGEIKPQNCFYGHMRYCKECFKKRRKKCENGA